MNYREALKKINRKIYEKRQILAHQLHTAKEVPDSFEARHRELLIAKFNREIVPLMARKAKLQCN